MSTQETMDQLAANLLNQMPNPPMSENYFQNVGELQQQRMIAQEIAASQIGEQMEAWGNLYSTDFWTAWTKANPVREPLLTKILELWPPFLEQWESQVEMYGPSVDTPPMFTMDWDFYLPGTRRSAEGVEEVNPDEIAWELPRLVDALNTRLDSQMRERMGVKFSLEQTHEVGTTWEQMMSELKNGLDSMDELAFFGRGEARFQQNIRQYLRDNKEWETEDLPAEPWVMQWCRANWDTLEEHEKFDKAQEEQKLVDLLGRLKQWDQLQED